MSIIRRQYQEALRGIATFALLLLFAGAIPPSSLAQTTKNRPSLKEVGTIARAQLGQREGYQPGDLIYQTDVKRVLKALAAAGWRPVDQKQILADTLPENNALVGILSTRRGTRFMRKIKDEELIYDRMDRVCRVSGGERMLADIAKLPNGEKLAKMSRPHGVPGFLDLLPKSSSGKVRSIKDYTKPTGRIYTEELLLERLKESYQGKRKDAAQQKIW